jgi:N-acetylglucosaminyl-diphospho-decaprenol L-rhamnosyltransferase
MRGGSRPTVAIPSFNGAVTVGKALESLRRQTMEHEVIVVDNASTDGTSELLARGFPEVHVISLAENVGFGRALNLAVRRCSSRTIVFVNNDVECEPRFLERLCASLDPASDIVMAAGVLLDADAPSRIDSAGVMFDKTLLAFDYLHGLPSELLDQDVDDPLGPTGGAAAFDRAAFDAVGGFDEQFFAYLEDVDLTARLLARGARCRLARGARARHRHSSTLGAGSQRKNELMGWGRGYTIGKYRLHRRPSRLARAIAAESAIALGQLAVDRTAVSVTARVAGFRAGLRARAEALPPLPPHASDLSVRAAVMQRGRDAASRRHARLRPQA